MTFDILKCENGWQLVQRFVNRADVKFWIFKTLPELAQWIIENLE